MLENPMSLLKGLALYAPEWHVRIAVVRLLDYIERDTYENAPVDEDGEFDPESEAGWESELDQWDILEILAQGFVTGDAQLPEFDQAHPTIPTPEEIEAIVLGFSERMNSQDAKNNNKKEE